MPLTDTSDNTPKCRIQLDDYTCGLIIGRFQSDESIADIQLAMSIPGSTIVNCHNRWKETGIGVSETRKGKQLKLPERDQRAVVCSSREGPFMPFTAHKEKLNTAGVDIHRQTLSKYAIIKGFGSYSTAYVPTLTPRHMQRRLTWVKYKVKRTPEMWEDVIWSDESKFNAEVSDGRVRVIRKEGESYHPDIVKWTVKFGNGSVMIWGCFWVVGLGPLVVMKGIINQEAYIDCLSNHFLPWLNNITAETSKNFILQEDGASCHAGSYAS
ncbi:hypothetical protein INT47_011679 [Mucor saturninus]|uniref:Transposase n=1 Tax=Mucor saturninus TaxID=64648 RepID=A0A8H7UPU2_9FUNG|nr:hypothetical protein INT47_011679 [Mucor saturninus]